MSGLWEGKLLENPYIMQFERIRRWNKILNGIKISNSPENEFDYHRDCIYAYFVFCFHLKDWIINSKVIEEKKVYDFFEQNKEMKICRDICNGVKHLELSRPSIIGGAGLARSYDHFNKFIKENKPSENIDYLILAGGEQFNVFDLADKCMELWEDFLNENSLLDQVKLLR